MVEPHVIKVVINPYFLRNFLTNKISVIQTTGSSRQVLFIPLHQGLIDPTGIEIIAKEPS